MEEREREKDIRGDGIKCLIDEKRDVEKVKEKTKEKTKEKCCNYEQRETGRHIKRHRKR